MQGMDEIRALYPTPDARADARIDEDGWQKMEEAERKIREWYPVFLRADEECVRANRAAQASKAEAEAARDRALATWRDVFGVGLN